jgi:nitrogen fixation NifU-like protein
MDDDLINELYESLVLEHSRHPRNFGKLECNCHIQKGKNPSCGDEITLYLGIENNLIKNIKFEGQGCALCMSSSSLMTQGIKNKTIPEAKEFLCSFIDFIVKETELNEKFEPMHVYKNIHKYPLRVKCVLLPWRTLEKSLEDYNYEQNN